MTKRPSMRRAVVLLGIVALIAPAPVRALNGNVLSSACTPEGPMDLARPAACQRMTFQYGPLHVTPGDNLIMFGPVTIEKPLVDGYAVRFKPELHWTDGAVPPIDVVHLHHAVWFSTAFGDPMFASGEEKTTFSLPDGYGMRTKPQDVWLLNYMLHNQVPQPQNVFITYTIDFIPRASMILKEVAPYWLDVRSGNRLNPIYNTTRGAGTNGECAFPKDECADVGPFGDKIVGNGLGGNGVGYTRRIPQGTIVWMAGHLHPGGLRTEVSVRATRTVAGVEQTKTVPVFTSHAVYWDYDDPTKPGGPPISWDMSMEVTRPDYRLRIEPNDTLILNSVYETSRASWYEGMGIVVMMLARDDTSGVDPFFGGLDPNDVGVTHGHMEEASNHGGANVVPLGPATQVETDTVAIGGFVYAPGQSQTVARVEPVVPAGRELRFVNADVPAAIFHTVTACALPCTGTTGISYPLADGAKDFDSFELGYGPPTATAASNRSEFMLDTTGMSGTYAYFCRVHPFMRGAFTVR